MIRPARPDEAATLSALALRSKASWGYPAERVEAFRRELTLGRDELADVYVLEDAGAPVGFHSLQRLDAERVELGHLFVGPLLRGHGHGRTLFEDATRRARDAGYRVLVIQGDPHARAFYEAMGARAVGERESDSVPGRLLPLFELTL
jgi:GNAT superfamily N-acetyltransferase